MQSSGFSYSYWALVVPDFMFALAVTTLQFAVAFTFLSRGGVFCTFPTSLFVFVAFCCPMAVFAAVVALGNLQIRCILFGRVVNIVEVESMSYATVSCVWVRCECYDGGIGGVFVVFTTQGCNIDNWRGILAFYAFYSGFVRCIDESVEFIFRDCVDYYAILWFAY